MSKVKDYLDSKQKSLHRQRRYETAHKKFSRARRYEQGEYFYWGYFVTRQRYRLYCQLIIVAEMLLLVSA